MKKKDNLSGRARMMAAAVIALFSLSGAAASPDTLTVERAFLELPVEMTEIIPRTSRLDMLEYLKNDSIYKGRTIADGLAWFLRPVTRSYMRVKVTNSSLLTLRLLPTEKKGPLLVTLYTLDGDRQAPDTQVRFYTPDWKPVALKSVMPVLKLEDFIDFAGLTKKEISEIRESIPFPTIEYTISPETPDMTARLTVGEYMGEEAFSKIAKRLRPRTLAWTGKNYRILNSGF